MKSLPSEKLLHLAIKANDLARVRLLIANGVNVEYQYSGEFPLGIAAELGNVSIVSELLKAGAHPDLGGWSTPLETASREGYIEIVKLLLDAKAEVDLAISETTPLMAAISKGNLDIVKLLIEAGANVNLRTRKSATALGIALDKEFQDISSYLYDRVFEDTKEYSIKSSLASACIDGRKKAIEFLIQFDTNLNWLVLDNLTPLMIACKNRNIGVVLTLIELGADVNFKNTEKKTALMFASKFRNSIEARRIIKGEYPKAQKKLVDLLYKSGANLNAQDAQGKTALIYAAEFGPYQIVDLLVKLGADYYIKDFQGMIAMDYARSRKTLLNFEQEHVMRIIDCLQSVT